MTTSSGSARLCFHSHHGCLHNCDALRCAVTPFGHHLRSRDRNRLAHSNGPSDSNKRITHRRCQQVDLELHAENGGIHRHFGQTRISACAVRNRGDRPRMNEAMLLRDMWGSSQTDAHFAISNSRELRTDCAHEFLSVEGLADTAFCGAAAHDGLYFTGG